MESRSLKVLPKERQNAFSVASQFVVKRTLLSVLSESQGETIRVKWRDFLTRFVEGGLDLSCYAAKPATFPKESFKLSVAVADMAKGYTSVYGQRGSRVREAVSGFALYLDAPLTYVLLYKTSKGKWEPLSYVGFMPDFKTNTLQIDQLQGCTTSKAVFSEEARRARMKFIKQPEEILFEAALDLAVSAGMHTIGLRKPSKSAWNDVADKPNTLYERIARSQGMQDFPGSDYYLLPL